jgi:hypothetical protein
VYHYKDSFDIAGNKVLESLTNSNFANNNYYRTYVYNGQNQLTFKYDSTSYGLVTKHYIFYNPQNLIGYSIDSVFKNGTWKPDLKVIYTYDLNDSLAEKNTYRWVNSIWVPKDSHLYNYSGNTRNDTLLVVDSLNGYALYSKVTTYFSYNNLDTMTLIQNYNGITHNWDSTYLYIDRYLFSPLRIDEWADYHYGGGWVIMDGYDYLYDSLYRVTTSINLVPDLCHDGENWTYNNNGTLNIYSNHSYCPNSSYDFKRTYFYSGGLLDVMVPENMHICSTDSVQILALNVFNSPNLHFQWNPSAGLSNDTILNPFLFTDTNTVYTLLVTDNFNTDTFTLNVTVSPGPPLLPVIVSIDTVYPCYSVTISADTTNSYPGIYEWYYNGFPLHVPFGGNETSHSLNGVYKIVATANNGCVDVDSITVTSIPPDTIPVIQTDICNNYMWTDFPGADSWSWKWNGFGLGFFQLDTFNLQNFNREDMSYYVIVKDTAGCEHFSAPVTLRKKVDFYHVIPEGCGGNCDASVILDLDNTFSPYTMYWDNGDTTTCIDCESYVHAGHCSGTTIVRFTDNDGCQQSDTIQITSNLHTFSVNLQLTPDPLQVCAGAITINTSSNDTTSSVYMCINDTNCSWFHTDTVLSNLCWGVYYITLYNNGCTYVDSIEIDSLALGKAEINSTNFRIYPNPAHGIATLYAGISGKTEICIYNLFGEIVSTVEQVQPYTLIDTRRFANGIYFIKIKGDWNYPTLKIVISN